MSRDYFNPDNAVYLNCRKSTSCAHKLDYHIVLSTKYRKPLFSSEIARFTKEIIVDECQQEGVILLALSVQINHIHIFLGLLPTHFIPDIIRKIKGLTTFKVRKHFLKEFAHRQKLFAEGYWIESLGFKNVAQIKAYLDGQSEHHPQE